MAARTQISKKIRFEVFKRDDFTCQYCGAKTPNVVLEVDHIEPVKLGGDNSMDNLITSCFDCNRGKSARELSSIPNSLKEKSERLAEIELQYKEYKKLKKAAAKRLTSEINEVDKLYSIYYPKYCLSDKFKNSSVKQFIQKLGVFEVLDSMETACNRISDSNGAIKYFCGICWNKIKEGYDE